MSTPSIFFSYARENSPFVIDLAKRLKEDGLDVWLDQIDIPAGARWDMEIQRALSRSNTMIVVLSKDSVKSQNVLDEVSYAIEENKTIVPVLIEECNVPFRLRRFQYVDLSIEREIGLSRLKKSLPGYEEPMVEPVRKQIVTNEAVSQAKQPTHQKTSESAKNSRVQESTATTAKKSKPKWIWALVGLIPVIIAAVLIFGNADKKKKEEQALVQIEETDWSKATTTGSTESYEEYLEVHPAGLYAQQAKDSIAMITTRIEANMNAEEKAWNDAKKLKTVEGFQSYLTAYPNGQYAEQATTLETEVNTWNDAVKSNTVNGYLQYLSQHRGSGLFIGNVADAIDNADDKRTGWLYAGRAREGEITSDRIFDYVCCAEKTENSIAEQGAIVKNTSSARRVYPSSGDTSSGSTSLPTVKNEQLAYVNEVLEQGSAVKYKITFSR